MTLRFKGGGSLNLRAASKEDARISVQYDPVSHHVSDGFSTIMNIGDASYTVYTDAVYYVGGKITLTGSVYHEVVNLTPAVASVAQDGLITRVSEGILKLLVKDRVVTLPLTVDMENKTDNTNQPNIFISTLAGSLAEHCQQQVDNRINSSMSMGANGLIYTTQNHAGATYVRNPNVWCADVDLTCISPWNSADGPRRAGTLITPRHIINAAHYELWVGNTVRFVAADNTVHDRMITGKVRLPLTTDFMLYTLSSDLPPSITPCKVMPENWTSYLVNNLDNRPPALGLDQEEKALIIDFYSAGSFLVPTDPDRLIFHEMKIGGDSGNPAFLIVNDELVLITVWTGGLAGSGTPVASYISDINAAIAAADAQAGVSTGYTVTPADFSTFPSY